MVNSFEETSQLPSGSGLNSGEDRTCLTFVPTRTSLFRIFMAKSRRLCWVCYSKTYTDNSNKSSVKKRDRCVCGELW